MPRAQGWLLPHSLMDGESKSLLGIKEQRAHLTLQDWEKTHKQAFQDIALEETYGKLSASSLAFWN